MRRVSPVVAVLDTLEHNLIRPFERSCPHRYLMTLTSIGYVTAVGVVAFAALILLPYWLALPLALAALCGLFWPYWRILVAQLHFHVRRVHVMGQKCTWRLSRG